MNKKCVLSTAAQKALPSGVRKMFELAQKYGDSINLTLGEPGFVKPEHIIDAGIQGLKDGKTKYTSNAGIKPLRDAIAYKLEKENGIKCVIPIKIFSNDANRFYKLGFRTECGSFEGQQMFGKEKLLRDGREVCFQKWCAMRSEDRCLTVLNRGTYAGSADGSDMYISLLRTPVYSAHPIDERPLAETDMHLDRIDMGLREFEFRLTANGDTPDADAESFNTEPYVLSFFPSGNGTAQDTCISLDNKKIILTRMYRDGDTLVTHLFNSGEACEKAKISFEGKNFYVELGAFEYKAYEYVNGDLNASGKLTKQYVIFGKA